MNTGNLSQESLAEFFRTGKADTDFEVREDYVIGVCALYPDRLAGPQEYAIRERSIVERAGRALSVCAQEAKDLAFQSAVRRMEGLVSGPKSVDTSTPAMVKTAQEIREKEPAPKPEPPQNSPAPEKAVQVPQEPTPEPPKHATLAPVSPPRCLELGDLRPASALPAAASEQESESEEQKIERARTMKIYCLGRLHECDGWTAGRLLDERPEVIVDMAKRYNGSRVEEKEALRTLYAEALRRVEKAA